VHGSEKRHFQLQMFLVVVVKHPVEQDDCQVVQMIDSNDQKQELDTFHHHIQLQRYYIECIALKEHLFHFVVPDSNQHL